MPKLVGFGLVKSDSFVDVFKEYPVQFFVVSDHCAVVANSYQQFFELDQSPLISTVGRRICSG